MVDLHRWRGRFRLAVSPALADFSRLQCFAGSFLVHLYQTSRRKNEGSDPKGLMALEIELDLRCEWVHTMWRPYRHVLHETNHPLLASPLLRMFCAGST